MTENRMKERVKVILGATPEGEVSLAEPNPRKPDQALQVLTLAQRTADEHLTAAGIQADKLRADAKASAEQMARDAQVHANNVRREADKILFAARATAEQTSREARLRGEEAQQTANQVAAVARSRAEATIGEARGRADQIRRQARLRYEDAVGGLGAQRESLQHQIETLEHFDSEYRARLASFMRGQLRALWIDGRPAAAELEAPIEGPARPPSPARREH